MLKQNESFHSF